MGVSVQATSWKPVVVVSANPVKLAATEASRAHDAAFDANDYKRTVSNHICRHRTGRQDALFLISFQRSMHRDAASKSLSGPLYMPIQPTSPARNTKIIYGGDSWIGAEDYSASTKSTLFTETIPDAGHQVYAYQFQHFITTVLRALAGHAIMCWLAQVQLSRSFKRKSPTCCAHAE